MRHLAQSDTFGPLGYGRFSTPALRVVAFVSIALGAALALVRPAWGSNPVVTTTLPLSSYADMAVDPTTSRVFVSGGPGTSTIVVLDFAGNVTDTITGQPGASDMVVNPATSRLYVALRDAGETSIINTATLAEVQRTSGALGWNPAVAGGRIWYSPASSDGLASIAFNLTGATTYSEFGTYPNSLATLAGAASSNTLAAAALGASPSALFTYDVTGGTPTLKAAGNGGSNLADVAVSPDGTRVLTAAGAPYVVQDFRTSDLELLTTYDTGPYPTAVDVSPNGGLVAGGVASFPPAPDVYVFSSGDSEARNRYTVGSATGGLVGAGLAFAPSGKRIFAVSAGSAVEFHVLRDADLYGSTLTVGATPTPAYVKQPVTLSGDLTLMDGVPAAGVPVQLDLIDGSGTRSPIATVTTDGAGHYSYTDPVSLPAEGTYTYEAGWDGDDTHVGAIARTTVQAQKAAATLRVRLSDDKISYRQSAVVTARLTGGFSNKQVALYAVDRDGVRELLVEEDVDEDGKLSLEVEPTANTKYVAEYAGDEAFTEASAFRKLYVAVITKTRLAGYYAISHGYRLYHRGGDPRQIGKVVPNHAGKFLRFVIQVRVGGRWAGVASPRYRIGSDGTVTVKWINPPRGYRFRVKNVFAGDGDHAGDSSRWVYFRVTT